MENDKLVRLSDVQTELMLAAERYTVAHEAHGMGTVVWSEDLISVSNALDTVRSIPAVDAVEVVRCRECECYPKDFDEDSWNWCCGIGDDTKPNDFCSQGQRREDGDGDG